MSSVFSFSYSTIVICLNVYLQVELCHDLNAVVTAYLAKLIANNGSWTSSISRCCAMMDCIFMRLLLVACCSVIVSVGDSSWLQRRDCTDSRNSVYKLFLSASARQHSNVVENIHECRSIK